MLHQTFLFLGQVWQLFEVSQILEFLRYFESRKDIRQRKETDGLRFSYALLKIKISSLSLPPPPPQHTLTHTHIHPLPATRLWETITFLDETKIILIENIHLISSFQSYSIGVGRFRILGGPRFRILGGGAKGGAKFPGGT